MTPFSLHLAFADSVDDVVRRRIGYAARVYCAVYGIDWCDEPRGTGVCLRYGEPAGPGEVGLTATYAPRAAHEPAPRSSTIRSATGALLPCFHGLGPARHPDLLGELFEWISGDHERSIRTTDATGRIPFPATIHGRDELDPTIPWANVLMRELSEHIATSTGRSWPDHPRPPFEHPTFAATHDLDFLPGVVRDSANRILRNLARAVLVRRPRLAMQIAGAGARGVIHRYDPLKHLLAMLEHERARDVRSSLNVVCRRAHRRDPNYRLDDQHVTTLLKTLEEHGVEVGVHGSYTSLDRPGRLLEEYQALSHAGIDAAGGRQHWLRYRDHQRLFSELARTGARYDSSAGYEFEPGFRNGAAFPFPPWDFRAEAPFPVLELPLAVMDVSLEPHPRPGDLARRVLERAAAHRWGGVALLWHDTVFGNAQLPSEIAQLYWDLLSSGYDFVRPVDIVAGAWPRYVNAGLLPSRRSDHL